MFGLLKTGADQRATRRPSQGRGKAAVTFASRLTFDNMSRRFGDTLAHVPPLGAEVGVGIDTGAVLVFPAEETNGHPLIDSVKMRSSYRRKPVSRTNSPCPEFRRDAPELRSFWTRLATGRPLLP
jgi:hypothetical protein